MDPTSDHPTSAQEPSPDKIDPADTAAEDQLVHEDLEEELEGYDTNTLAYAQQLIQKGKRLSKAGDNAAAVDFLSRAVEICVSLHGELSPDCVKAYYEYGRALLYKAQDESDPLVDVPKDLIHGGSKAPTASIHGQCSESTTAKGESNDKIELMSCDSGETEEITSSRVASAKLKAHVEAVVDGADKNNAEVGCDGSEDENVEEEEEEEEGDESDLDLAWKMLDVARAIVEKKLEDTTQKVEILEALGEVSLEREDIETSLSDYLKALNILERLNQPDSRHLAEINFRVSWVLELASRVDEAVPYCKKAISLCGARLEQLKQQTEDPAASKPEASEASLLDLNQSADDQSQASITSAKIKEIKALGDLLSDLEKKLEDLEQVAAQNPKSVVSELPKIMGSKPAAFSPQQSSPFKETGHVPNASFNSHVAYTSASNGSNGRNTAITDLGVVGRGVKRVNVSSSSDEPSLKKVARD